MAKQSQTVKQFSINILIIIASVTFLDAQWENDQRLTFDTSSSNTSLNNAWCIGARQDDVFIVWQDFRDGNGEIYYKWSSDAGSNWSSDARLTYASGWSIDASIVVSDSFLHVVWDDDRQGSPETYYKYSTNSGLNWSIDTCLTNVSYMSGVPSISVSGSLVHVVWLEGSDGNSEIYYKRSTNSGNSWSPSVRLTNNLADSWYPCIASSGTNVSVAWEDDRDGNLEIYYKRSSDSGTSWSSDIRLSDYPDNSEYSSIAATGVNVHVVWRDNRDGNLEIYYKRSTDSGLGWSSDMRLTNAANTSASPSICVSQTNVHVVWEDYRDGNNEIYYKQSIDNGANWSQDVRLTNAISGSANPFVCISGTYVHVVWYDHRDGNNEIYYKRNPTGNVITESNASEPKIQYYLRIYPTSSAIKFEGYVPSVAPLRFEFYDIAGREVVNFYYHPMSKNFTYYWQPNDLPAGVYSVYMSQNDGIQTKTRVVWVK